MDVSKSAVTTMGFIIEDKHQMVANE